MHLAICNQNLLPEEFGHISSFFSTSGSNIFSLKYELLYKLPGMG